MKRTLTLIITGALLIQGCAQTEQQPRTPIFEGTEEISLSLPLNGGNLSASSMTYNVPTEVKFVVFGLFSAQITTSGKTITNPTAFVAGSRDGLSDFVRGSQTRGTLHLYNQGTRDFESATGVVGNTPYYWAVWGYDQYGNLTHSSPQRQIVFP